MSLAIAIAATTFVMPARAQIPERPATRVQSTTGAVPGTTPLQVLYMFSGVWDDGGGNNTGNATSVHCTSFSSIPETVQFAVLNWDGSVVANAGYALTTSTSLTASTHPTLFSEVYLSPGTIIDQGVMVVFATSVNVICSAMLVNAAAPTQGVALHPIRFNPWPGGEE
jgi:hypothetical protein